MSESTKSTPTIPITAWSTTTSSSPRAYFRQKSSGKCQKVISRKKKSLQFQISRGFLNYQKLPYCKTRVIRTSCRRRPVTAAAAVRLTTRVAEITTILKLRAQIRIIATVIRVRCRPGRPLPLLRVVIVSILGIFDEFRGNLGFLRVSLKLGIS